MHHFFRQAVAAVLCLWVLLGVVVCADVAKEQEAVAGQVLRLHIVANSDSAYDQEIKLQVRNRVLKDCGYLFQNCKNAEEAASIARLNSGRIRKIAQEELRKNGILQPSSVYVQPRNFPSKEYGGIRLPAGQYTALTIRIGTARGQNWWCVMYPPLCLTGDAVKADEETLKKLQQTLTAQEYALVTETEEIQVNLKFKIAEILGRWF